ncbi:bifunctional biotin--[acetyl-CoA-carboxylase] ligase/biotin operon repressor BirA [Avibacterium sp. 20-15]|uniref:bifunctional biotin--[acetyl-CoA-carboxylase] ligase/biotin operon repressor BirA n=1 Tax=unclassified Avibacterium TaxID=2685287 RepID=UPI0020261838|nr:MULTISPECIES: bifunctional biotin--[acetyl-CoA-carboxylase] ligase/biotin operon repressor BirA [unclassified Avibacterium]MCW9733658.1 bifunctional biotin--[acetyl-CoA-carboxylase] ligase/biotin operon repressor BirA [Avibacterium sp. 20-15]URL03512.1 bifunctional biotin--[acetyl-CoA-carboxylase] ligase/biotin operon repressor BirA [Avibacterium sp. 20-132]
MFKLLTLLADGKKNSRQNLTALLHCDEREMNTHIQALSEQGIHFELNGDEIQLKPELPLLSAEHIKQRLAPYPVVVKPVIHSTNQFLLEQIEQLKKGQLCLAEYQYAGRGRRGRDWLSPFAGQIILSAYWTFPPNISLNGLSLVIGIAIAETLQTFGAQSIGLKWPNDVLLQGRKLAGVLVEIANRKNGLLNLVIGIGINLALPKQASINQPWAELREILPHFDRDEIIIALVQRLYHYLDLFEQEGMTFFHSRWAEWDAFLNLPVSMISENGSQHGIERGIDSEGYLLLETKQGIVRFNGGEVSLRRKV